MKTWSIHQKQLDSRTVVTTFANTEGALSFREVIDLWRSSEEFRAVFSDSMAHSHFRAFFWETPPITAKSAERPFEYVLVEGRSLEQLTPDPTPFSSHFSGASNRLVVTFPNLGGDAVLVVPTPIGDEEIYTHLANFVRNAPREQVDDYWQSVGAAMDDRLSGKSTWLSTAGLGVSWLHLRLDSRPKYYRYHPYKTDDSSS